MLLHYEKHTNIKQPKFSFNIKAKVVSDSKDSLKSFDIKSTISDESRIKNFYYTPKQIISIVLTFFTILCLYLLISFLSKEQLNEIQNNQNLEPFQNNISDNSLLAENNFLKDNFINSVSKKLKYKIKSPYIFEIISNNKTKIKLSYKDKNDKEIILCNKIVPKDTLHSYHIEDIIFFELWAANDVTITIKNESD